MGFKRVVIPLVKLSNEQSSSELIVSLTHQFVRDYDTHIGLARHDILNGLETGR